MNQNRSNQIYRLADDFSLFKGEFQEKRFQLFNIVDGAIFKLNETAYDMLSLFDGEKELEAVFNELKKMYDAEEEQLRQDFACMVDEWVQKKVLIEPDERC